MCPNRDFLGYRGQLAQVSSAQMDASYCGHFSQDKLAMRIVAGFVSLHVWHAGLERKVLGLVHG